MKIEQINVVHSQSFEGGRYTFLRILGSTIDCVEFKSELASNKYLGSLASAFEPMDRAK